MTTDALPPLPKRPPQVDLDQTRERLTKLGLVHAAEALGEHVANAAKATHPPHRFLDGLLEAELALSGHLKTGQSWPGQNRPVARPGQGLSTSNHLTRASPALRSGCESCAART